MVQLQEYHRPEQSTGPYAYNAVAPGAPINLVQLAAIYQTGPGHVRYYDFDKEIRRVARPHSTNEAYLNLFPFEDATDLLRRLGTSKYLMSPFEGGYENAWYCCREVPFRRDVVVDEREELESSAPASHLFHPEPVDQRFLPADWNTYRHHFDVPMFKYLTPIHGDFKAARRRNVHCRDLVLEAVIINTASSLVTAEAVQFALQDALANRQYVQQHLGYSKPTLEQAVSRSLTDTPPVLESTTSAQSSLLGEFRSPTHRGAESTRELVNSTTTMPLVLVRSKHTDGPLVEMTRCPSRPPIEQIFGTLPSGGRRTFWNFFTTKSQTLGPGQFRALAREHVFLFHNRCPVDGRLGDPNLRLINHRSGILIQKRALESDICRHYTGHATFNFMASAEMLKEVHEVCRLQVDDSSTFVWGTDC